VGGWRSRTTTSVHVTGKCFPARMWNGTPASARNRSRVAGQRTSPSSSPMPRPSPIGSRETVRARCCPREGRNRTEDLHLLVSDRFAVGPDRRLHGQITQHLEEMILNHVAHGARLVVERTSALNPEVFRHGDLHALDVIAIPEGLQERVGEAEEEHVVHRAAFPGSGRCGRSFFRRSC